MWSYYPWMKPYSLVVSILSGLLLILYIGVFCVTIYRYASPPPQLQSLDDFSYNAAKSIQAEVALQEETKPIFKELTEEEFNKKPEYYFNIINEEYSGGILKLAAQSGVYAILWFLVFSMHIKIWRYIKRNHS